MASEDEDETVLFLQLQDTREPFRTWKVGGERASCSRHLGVSCRRGYRIWYGLVASSPEVDCATEPLNYTETQTNVSPTNSGSELAFSVRKKQDGITLLPSKEKFGKPPSRLAPQ